jgi:hypothetical protein
MWNLKVQRTTVYSTSVQKMGLSGDRLPITEKPIVILCSALDFFFILSFLHLHTCEYIVWATSLSSLKCPPKAYMVSAWSQPAVLLEGSERKFGC